MLANIPKRQKILVMLAVMSGMLLAALDQTIVATALPQIVAELHGLQYLSWVVTVYLLSSTVAVPISGKLSDIYGRKRLFIAGILIFVAGSALSGLSRNMPELIIFRAIQGIGAGAIMSNSFAVIGDLFAPAERGRWQGLIAATFGLSSLIGPLLGGFLTDHASWRWNFYINIPVGLLGLFMISTFMPRIPLPKRQKVDYLGAGLLAGGLSTTLLALIWGGSRYAWASPQILALVTAGTMLLAGFAFVEHKHAADPILPLSLFKNPIFKVATLILFLTGAAMFSAITFLPLFAQDVLGRTATSSGVILMPLVLGAVLSNITFGQLVSRIGRYKAIVIFGVSTVTVSLLALSTIGISTTSGHLALRMAALGIGVGATMPVLNLVLQNAFKHSQLGVVTASGQLARSIGATMGVALMGSILNNRLTHHLVGSADAVGTNQLSSLSPQNISPAVKTALASSISEIFLIVGVAASIGFLASWFLREIPLRTTHERQPEVI